MPWVCNCGQRNVVSGLPCLACDTPAPDNEQQAAYVPRTSAGQNTDGLPRSGSRFREPVELGNRATGDQDAQVVESPAAVPQVAQPVESPAAVPQVAQPVAEPAALSFDWSDWVLPAAPDSPNSPNSPGTPDSPTRKPSPGTVIEPSGQQDGEDPWWKHTGMKGLNRDPRALNPATAQRPVEAGSEESEGSEEPVQNEDTAQTSSPPNSSPSNSSPPKPYRVWDAPAAQPIAKPSVQTPGGSYIRGAIAAVALVVVVVAVTQFKDVFIGGNAAPTNNSGNSCASAKVARSGAAIDSVLLAAPQGLQAVPDYQAGTGSIDRDVALHNEIDPSKALSTLDSTRFLQGYSRQYTNGAGVTVLSRVYEFAAPVCATDYVRIDTAADHASQSFPVAGIAGATGVVKTNGVNPATYRVRVVKAGRVVTIDWQGDLNAVNATAGVVALAQAQWAAL